jgi:hypothetical protein
LRAGLHQHWAPNPAHPKNHKYGFIDELVTGEIGQVGTQWDGLAHPMMRVEGVEGWKDGDYFYKRSACRMSARRVA